MPDIPLKILFVTSEVAPYSKTGGLADVSSALPHSLAKLGHDVRVLSPLYGSINRKRHGIGPVSGLDPLSVELRGRKFPGALQMSTSSEQEPQFYFLDVDVLYDRPGIYVDPATNQDYLDNDYRYIALSKAAVELCRRLKWSPDVFHVHDWETSLVTLFVSLLREQGEFESVRTVMTIHNMAYQGMFSAEALSRIGNADRFFRPGGPLEFFGQVNLLKAGIEFADGLNTVSPTYAREIQGSREFGYGLETVLERRGDLVGILNGIDVDIWDPKRDTLIPAPYSSDNLKPKARNKQALCSMMGLPYRVNTPIFGVISRIVSQKGFDLLEAAIPEILRLPSQLVLLGSGDPLYERSLSEMASKFPDRMAVRIGYDDRLSHLIEAGADIFLMPSHYEPCGLNQMMSMRYGTVPVVRATGGLADTVTDADVNLDEGTGFSFSEYDVSKLVDAASRAVQAYRNPTRWTGIQQRGMRLDFSWRHSAEQYMKLYRRCINQPARVVAL